MTARHLFDALRAEFPFKSDYQLAGKLDLYPADISNMRAGRRKIGPAVILAVHEKLGMPVARVRELLRVTA